ncbi:MAG: tyrosine-protein phosphatase [Bacteroidales bacterium]|nr:tyrosine-protein phosphatase [Candidatus Equibacterium intestinale]
MKLLKECFLALACVLLSLTAAAQDQMPCDSVHNLYYRQINIPGCDNVRDVGGYPTADGRMTRRGLLYRGSEMTGIKEEGHTLNITDEGKRILLEDLKIHSDVDLRGDYQCPEGWASPLGPSVKYARFQIGAYIGAFIFDGHIKYAECFKYLSHKENYPVYIHCFGGADRTGTVCFLLQMLLGVSYEDAIWDYELTSLTRFGHRGRNDNPGFKNFWDLFVLLPGKTLQEKAEAYMDAIGLTKEEIESLKSIFLD